MTELEAIEQSEPLKVTRAPLPEERNPAYRIKMCADALSYQFSIRAKYLFLLPEEYAALCREIGTWKIAGNLARITMLYGIYVASFPGIPQEPEYAQARLTFQYLDAKIPPLQKGEVLVLYKEK